MGIFWDVLENPIDDKIKAVVVVDSLANGIVIAK